MIIDSIRITELKKVLEKNNISPTQWLMGFEPDQVEYVLSIVEEFFINEYGNLGKFTMIWEFYDHWGFGGDASFYLVIDGNKGYELTIPFNDGDFIPLFDEIDHFINSRDVIKTTDFKSLDYIGYEFNATTSNQI